MRFKLHIIFSRASINHKHPLHMSRNTINHFVFWGINQRSAKVSVWLIYVYACNQKDFFESIMFYVLWANHHQTSWWHKGFQQAVTATSPPPLPSCFNVSFSENDMILFKLSYLQKGKVYCFIDSSQRSYPVCDWNKKINVILLGNVSLSCSFIFSSHFRFFSYKKNNKRKSGNWTLLTSFLIKRTLNMPR